MVGQELKVEPTLLLSYGAPHPHAKISLRQRQWRDLCVFPSSAGEWAPSSAAPVSHWWSVLCWTSNGSHIKCSFPDMVKKIRTWHPSTLFGSNHLSETLISLFHFHMLWARLFTDHLLSRFGLGWWCFVMILEMTTEMPCHRCGWATPEWSMASSDSGQKCCVWAPQGSVHRSTGGLVSSAVQNTSWGWPWSFHQP